MAVSDAELRELQDRLNAFEPHEVHAALGTLEPSGAAGPRADIGKVASGPLDFGSVEPGVLIYRLEPGKVRLRITVADMTGGYYDELEVPDATIGAVVEELTGRLGDDVVART
jgi:hypothetical protein